jgi:hypothetical protein
MISVLISDKPANPKTFQEYTSIGAGEKYVPGIVTATWVAMHSDDKAFQGFSFTIDPKQRVMLNDVLVGHACRQLLDSRRLPRARADVDQSASGGPHSHQRSGR